jgi:hypothetical protein
MASRSSSENTSACKTCERCGTAFTRNLTEKTTEWARRRFCSITCRNRANTKRLIDVCGRGHPWNEANIKINANGTRQCRACIRELARITYRKTHPLPKRSFDANAGTKVCGACSTRKPTADFYKISKPGKDPYAGYCRDCNRLKYKQWVADNSERSRVRHHTRRARKREAEGKYTAENIARIKKEQRGRCAVCRKRLKQFQIDHIIPLAKGGTNFSNNIQLLCPGCNRTKRDTDPLIFMRRLGRLL